MSNTSYDMELDRSENYNVKFNNVLFSYNPGSVVLDSISFEIEAGQTIAIVGSTGAGKSTISKLILRFFDVDVGNITINGQDIKKIKLNSLRDYIGIIPQDIILFNESLYFNVLYGNPKVSCEEVMKAARLNALINSLPNGYDTLVSERGVKLSGGEKQRIARAILKKPKIFIFDEATSSLDSKTDRAIQENLEQVSARITTIIIAHRLSTVINAQKILVLDKGKIKEKGTHHSLIEKNGLYHQLWYTQMQKAIA